MFMTKNKTVFLDRDGVINEDSDEYIKSRDEFHFIPGSRRAVQLLNENGFDVILITNQSAVNRGMITEVVLHGIHELLNTCLAEIGASLLDIFFCPHRPDEKCNCRKPETGMLKAAKKKYGISLEAAYFVGDSIKDVECARNAGLKGAILVLTGKGRNSVKKLAEKNITPDFTAENLLEAVYWIIDREKLV